MRRKHGALSQRQIALAGYEQYVRPPRHMTFDCTCLQFDPPDDTRPWAGCPICKGKGDYSLYLNRRQHHQILVAHRQWDKVFDRQMHETLLEWRRDEERKRKGGWRKCNVCLQLLVPPGERRNTCDYCRFW